MSIRTDQVLGRLLAAAECAAGGTENLIVVFSADHGVAPVPEVMQARKMPGGRIDKKAYLAAINKGLAEKFGEGKWILATAEAGLYINHVYTGHALMEHTASFSQIDEYVARGFFRERSPDVIVITKPYYLFGASGTSHGTPYDYDSHVPLVFYGAGISSGTYFERVGVSDVGPTLAALLHIETPSGSVGHILSEVVARQASTYEARAASK
jgi:arylsulfatase A-like enzyme